MLVLVAHIGPVQEFIASAKKCRELWFGSWLLSELARAAAEAIVEVEGRPEEDVLVFPGASTKAKDRSVANKIVARVSNAEKAAQKANAEMHRRLDELGERAFRYVPGAFGEADKATAKDQIHEALELLWAAAPLGEETGAYKLALGEAERLLAAVKNSRRFKQPPWAKAGVAKSRLDGQREVVLKSEGLCGLGVLKRFGNRDEAADGEAPERIFSTLHLASGPFRSGLAALGAKAEFDVYRKDLEALDPRLVDKLDLVLRDDEVTGGIDGTVFYETRLVEACKEQGLDKEKQHEAKSALRVFLKRIRPTLGEPCLYYALLLGDGDRMGRVIQNQKEAKDHRALSKQLEEFASGTRKTVEEKHGGALIYAGGDDVLALLPLHEALACAQKLAQDFAEAMRRWTIPEEGEEKSPTLSIGMAIVHQLFPLDEALECVRKTEKAAKAVKGKNALAVVVRKRGGEPVQIEGAWGDIDERLRALISLHNEGEISTKTQYELMDLAERLKDAGDLAETMIKVRRAETERILARKEVSGGGASCDAREKLAKHGAFEDPARLGRELYVAALLARAERQAKPPKAEEKP